MVHFVKVFIVDLAMNFALITFHTEEKEQVEAVTFVIYCQGPGIVHADSLSHVAYWLYKAIVNFISNTCVFSTWSNQNLL